MDRKTLRIITQLEESPWRAETRLDVRLMRRAFADDSVEFGQSGRSYGREALLAIAADTSIDAILPLKHLNARHLASDVILVTYVSETTVAGSALKANRSSIWSFQDGRWRLRFHQGTPMKD